MRRRRSAPPASARRLAAALGWLAASAGATSANARQAPTRAAADSTPRVIAIDAPRTPLPPDSATAGVRRFSFIAYGDTRNSRDGDVLQEIHGLVVESMLGKVASMARGPDPVAFVVSSGDAVMNGQIVRELNTSYTPVVDRLTAAGLPFFSAAGNHDVTGARELTNPQRVIGLANLLAANANLIPPDGSPRRLAGYPTYAFGYGNTFVLAFDSNIAGDSTQFRWVRSQLESLDRSRYANIVIVCHQPAFSSGFHGGTTVESATLAMRQLYLPLFRRHHVKLLLVGHEHVFEHWVERYRDSTGAHRLDEIVSGGGGAPLYWFTAEPDLKAYEAAGAAERVTVRQLVKPGADSTGNPHHFVVVHVEGEKLTIEVVGVAWGAGFAPYAGRTKAVIDAPRGKK